MTFASSDPRIARFVAVRPGGGGERRPSPGRPRRLRARRRRSPRLPVPARARDGRRHRDRPGPARHEPGPRDSGPDARRRRHPDDPDPGRHVRVPELRPCPTTSRSPPPRPSRPPPRRRRRPIPLRRRPNRSLSPSRRSRNRCPRRRSPAPAPPVPAAPAPPAPLAPAAPPAADPARPPVAPAPKPPVAPAPPTPPQGLQVQAVEAPQVQPFQAMQHAEQRREEYAYETDSAAVAYAHPPSPLPWEIAGGVAVLALVMAGGGLAGRSRSRAVAVARATSTLSSYTSPPLPQSLMSATKNGISTTIAHQHNMRRSCQASTGRPPSDRPQQPPIGSRHGHDHRIDREEREDRDPGDDRILTRRPPLRSECECERAADEIGRVGPPHAAARRRPRGAPAPRRKPLRTRSAPSRRPTRSVPRPARANTDHPRAVCGSARATAESSARSAALRRRTEETAAFRRTVPRCVARARDLHDISFSAAQHPSMSVGRQNWAVGRQSPGRSVHRRRAACIGRLAFVINPLRRYSCADSPLP